MLGEHFTPHPLQEQRYTGKSTENDGNKTCCSTKGGANTQAAKDASSRPSSHVYGDAPKSCTDGRGKKWQDSNQHP